MFQEDALLLVAHGSARYPDAGRMVEGHAAALRAEGVFAEVAVGLLNGAPAAVQALAALHAAVVHVVPFFMEAGWFTQIVVPRALGLDGPVVERNGRVLRYAAPVGTHAGMANVIEARVRRVVEASRLVAVPLVRPPPPGDDAVGDDTAAPGSDRMGIDISGGHTPTDDVPALLVVGHGSARAPGRVTALHGHVARLAATARFPRVEAAFLEEPPFAATAMARCRDAPLAVLGFFAGEGGHVRDDLPALIAAERMARGEGAPPLLDCGGIGEEPAIRRLILDLVAAMT